MRSQLIIIVGLAAISTGVGATPTSGPATTVTPAPDILRTPDTDAARRYRFSDADEALLDEIQRGCHQYFWTVVAEPAMLARDRLKAPVASVASVGFQLAALPIAVERKWITRAQGEERARAVLSHLIGRTDNKMWGVYIHYPDFATGGMSRSGFNPEVSTVDTALLFVGAMTAASYFGGDVSGLVDRMLADADWSKFIDHSNGFMSMGWEPNDSADFSKGGRLIDADWWNAGAEEHLVYLMAIGAPNAAHAIDPASWYRLQRLVKRWKDGPPFVVSVNGVLFHYFFVECYLDWRELDADQPALFEIKAPRVDWFENSRRAVLTHRQRCIELAEQYKTLSTERWGMAPCVGKDGYLVPDLAPSTNDKDLPSQGTVAPYAAGSSIMFTPEESIAALRAFRELKGKDGKPLVWKDPNDGGFGFWDAFNLEQDYVSDDIVGIDHGPMMVAIENARTGLVWKLFMAHPVAKRALERIKVRPGR